MDEDPWVWLLGRTPQGAWRHVPYRAVTPGDGQDPALEPRVEVIRRLIAYPEPVFREVVRAVSGAETAERPARWVCYRGPGEEPTRPYWLCFVSVEPGGGRRFHLGLELFDRARLAVWFFSGYDPAGVPPEYRTAFPGRTGLYLPRVEVAAADLERVPVAAWVRDAWRDRLTFARDAAGLQDSSAGGRASLSESVDESRALDASLLALPDDPYHQHGLRVSRARLVVCPAEGDVSLEPICRLTTMVGRDPRCHAVLEHRQVSMEHLRIVWRGGVPEVEDLGSKNGTTVDGARLPAHAPRRIGAEARIDLGELPCLFIADPRPGLDGPAQEPRLEALVERGVVQRQDVEAAGEEARRRGVTPLEILLAQRKVQFGDWAGRPTAQAGSCAAALAWLGAGLAAGAGAAEALARLAS